MSNPLLHSPATIAPAQRLRELFKGALILAGEFDQDSAQRALEQGRADFVAFGRLFIANPDLVERFRARAALNTPDEASFYVGGDQGYIDYPFLHSHAEAVAS